MRVCLISSSFYPATIYGGPIFATWDLSRRLVENNIEVCVSTTDANGRDKLEVSTNSYVQKKDNLFIKYYYEEIINRFSFSFIFGIWRDIKKSDVIYIQYLFHYTVFFSLIISLLQRKRIIICPRGSLSSFTLNNRLVAIKSLWLYFISPILNNIEWHASSFLEKNDILKRFPDAQVIVINDGVDYNSFQYAPKLESNELIKRFTDNRYDIVSSVFFSMGRLHKIKCFDVLIDAFNLYVQKDQYAKLIIAGADDGHKEMLIHQINSLNLSDSVFLIGHISFDDKSLLLNNCDLFTLASDFESFGIVIAEALSCGVPVVVSNKTQWEDIEKNNCGIFTYNDKYSFFQAFNKILEMKFIDDNIKEYVRLNYDWDIIIKEFMNLLKSK